MKVKLIDVKTETYIAEYGTCEMCFYNGLAMESTYIFEKEDGTRFEVEGFYWSYGELKTIMIDNFIDLADYVNHQDFDENTTFDFDWLDNLAEAYYEKKQPE